MKRNRRRKNSEVEAHKKELMGYTERKHQRVKGKFIKAKGLLAMQGGLAKKEEANALSKDMQVKYGRIIRTVSALCRSIDAIGEPCYDKYTTWLSSNTNTRNCALWMGCMVDESEQQISPTLQDPAAILAALVFEKAVACNCPIAPTCINATQRKVVTAFTAKFRQLYKQFNVVWKKKDT